MGNPDAGFSCSRKGTSRTIFTAATHLLLWASALIVLLACATGCTSLSSLQASHEKPASLDHTIIVMGHGIVTRRPGATSNLSLLPATRRVSSAGRPVTSSARLGLRDLTP